METSFSNLLGSTLLGSNLLTQAVSASIVLFIASFSALAIFRLGVLAFISFGHWRFFTWSRFKGRQIPLRGTELAAWFWRESTSITAVLVDRIRGIMGAGRDYESRHLGIPVVCIHGFSQNSSNWLRLRARLANHGRSSLAPDLGLPLTGGLERYEPPLEAALDAALGRKNPTMSAENKVIDVVAHSMGGIVLRQVLARRPDLAAAMRTVITLGSPHLGTAAARGLNAFPEARGLSRTSASLLALPTLTELAPEARIITVGALLDHVVYPLSTCHHGGHESVTLDAPGHVGLLTHRGTIQRVLEFLLPSA